MWGYSYDSLGRLTSATRDGELAESYTHDAQGNRTSYRAPIRGIDQTVTPAFDEADRVLSSGEATYAYSPEGELASRATSAGVTIYAYTGLSELESVSLPDGRVVTYRYDANGSRVAKLIDGAITERYEWADPTRLLATYDGTGALTRRFLYADARVPYGMETSAGTYWLAFDQAGSLRAVTDESGALVKVLEHDSFGNVIADSDPGFNVPLGFAGGLADADTGLVHFGAREYDSAAGRWISRDPIGLSGGDVNLYGYCLGDPVGLVDPAGLLWKQIATGLGVANVVVAVIAVGATVLSGGTAFLPAVIAVIAWGVAYQGANDMAYQEGEIGPYEHYSNRRVCSLGMLPGPAELGAAQVAMGAASLGSLQGTQSEQQWQREREFLGHWDEMYMPGLFDRPEYGR